MSQNKKYYYLKLKETYFDQDAIQLMESMPEGAAYSNILLKLYLKSLKSDGRLQVDEGIPYTARMIATITRHREAVVKRALEVYRRLGLAQEQPDGALLLTGLSDLVGRDSTEGARKRLERRTKRGQMTAAGADVRPPEIEKETEIETEPEREKEKEAGRAPTPAPEGRYQNVYLSEGERRQLREELGDRLDHYVQQLSAYVASTGKCYHNHAATIRRWAEADARAAGLPAPADYACSEEESL